VKIQMFAHQRVLAFVERFLGLEDQGDGGGLL
jgi:hypothetical protein